MKILILAAGYGTRLYPLITDTPKPLLAVGDKPLVNHLIDKVRAVDGVEEVIVVTNNKFCGHFERWAEENKSFPAPIRIVNDGTTAPEDRLGSVGDIHFAIKTCPIQDDLLILGGDNLFDFSIEECLSFASKKRPAVTIGLYDIRDTKAARSFGVVQTAVDGRVVSFEEKPQQPRSSLIAMCLYYMPKESLSFLEEYVRESQKVDKAGDYIHWLVERKTVYGFKFEGRWYDIGSIESYHEAQKGFNKQ